jgi:hypothetical protein
MGNEQHDEFRSHSLALGRKPGLARGNLPRGRRRIDREVDDRAVDGGLVEGPNQHLARPLPK